MNATSRVKLNGRAEAFQAYDEGSIPFTRSSWTAKQGATHQQRKISPFSSVVEHSLGKGEATCSIHVKGTTSRSTLPPAVSSLLVHPFHAQSAFAQQFRHASFADQMQHANRHHTVVFTGHQFDHAVGQRWI